jgi:hypothetical protein
MVEAQRIKSVASKGAGADVNEALDLSKCTLLLSLYISI